MSNERIKFVDAPMITRLISLFIDLVVGVIIGIFCQFGMELEWDILWSKILPASMDFEGLIPYFGIASFIVLFPVYFILTSNFTNGQTIGKKIMNIRVVTEDQQSTKRNFKLHLRRFFFMKAGTKVIKEEDPGVKGL